MKDFPLIHDILVIYIVAIVSVLIFRKLKQSSIIGYLVGGIFVGPSAFNLVENINDIEYMAEFGVLFFLFLVGLEFPMEKLGKMKKMIFGIGGLQVFITAAVFYGFLSAYGFPRDTALILGIILSLSSTAIVLKVLVEKGALNSLNGKTSLSILLFQDLMVVPIMLLIPLMAGEIKNPLWLELGLTFLKAGLLIGALFIVAHYVLKPVSRRIAIQRNPELFIITFLFFAVGTGFLTESAGFSMLLGAFMAGLLLSESEFKHQITAEFLPIRDSLLPIFFVSVGMLVDVQFLFAHLLEVVAISFLIVVLKFLTMGTILKFFNYPLRHALMASLSLAHVGEFAFVLLLEGKLKGIFTEEVYQLSLSTIVVSMLVTPMLINRSGAISEVLGGRALFRFLFPVAHGTGETEETESLQDHVVVFGYGVTGKNIVYSLTALDIPFVVVDSNWNNVEAAQREGIPILYGDSERLEILHAARVEKARAVVLTFGELDATVGTVKRVRQISEKVFVLVRTHYVTNFQRLKRAGADIVVLEEFQSSLLFISELLGKFEYDPGMIKMLLDDIKLEQGQ